MKEKGISFQKRLSKYCAKLFPDALHLPDQWIEFDSPEGYGWARPDHLIVFNKEIIIIEAKLSQRKTAITELTKLYLPVVSGVFPHLTPIMVHAFKNIRSKDKTLDSLLDVFNLPNYKLKTPVLYQHIH